jgi:von Willebrand factor type A domain
MSRNLPAHHSQRVAKLLQERQAQARGRLIFVVDATASRQPTWDIACELQAEMFAEAAKTGALEVQLVYYRGRDECRASRWTADPRELADAMTRVMCMSGYTQIGKALAHARKEHGQQAVNAIVFVSDAMEEEAGMLFDAAAGLGVPLFMFQEGHDRLVEETFKQLARLTKGAYSQFSPNSARELAELLRAVACFAVGGLTALADQRSESARNLLGQLKNEG